MDNDFVPTEEEVDGDALLASLDELLKDSDEKTDATFAEAAPETPPKNGKWQPLKWLRSALCVLAACAVMAGGVYGFITLRDPYHRKIMPGVTFGMVDLSGMTKSQAKKELDKIYKNPTMVVTFPGREDDRKEAVEALNRVTVAVTFQGAGAYVYTDRAVQAAYAIGRTEPAEATPLPFQDYLKLDEAALRELVQDFEDSLLRHTIPHTAYLEGAKPDLADPKAVPQTLVITPSQAGPKIDGDTLLRNVLEAYQAGNLTCAYSGKISLTTPDLADLQKIYDGNCYPAREPSIDRETLEVTPGKPGYEFDVKDATAKMRRQGGEDLRISLSITQPSISDKDVYFQEVLGHCETPYSNNPKRITNLELACKALDGLVLKPGQDFSYNETLGERTAEKGYQPAPAYSGTTLVDSLGGGICQVSSTLYLASVYAELTITERKNHGYPVHYIPYGMDATVNWGFTDLKMRNDSDLPVKIKADASDGFVRIDILGLETRNYDIKMTYSVGGRYVKTYMSKYDRETGALLSKDFVALSSYLEDVYPS